MQVSSIRVELTASDLNSIALDYVPGNKLVFTDISPDGIRGQVKVLFWSIDFTARPAAESSSEVSVEISASKLVTIPPAIVQRQLRDAIKDGPPGIDVIRQSLRVHLPSLLRAFGLSLSVREIQCYDGYVRLQVEDIKIPSWITMLGGNAGQRQSKDTRESGSGARAERWEFPGEPHRNEP